MSDFLRRAQADLAIPRSDQPDCPTCAATRAEIVRLTGANDQLRNQIARQGAELRAKEETIKSQIRAGAEDRRQITQLINERDEAKADLARLARERDRLIENWPEWHEGGGDASRVVIVQDGGWWLDTPNVEGEYPTKEAAVRAVAGLDQL